MQMVRHCIYTIIVLLFVVVMVVMVAMVVIAVFIVIHAEAVFAVSAAVLESVQQVVLFKKGERAEDAAAIHRRQQILYIGQ